MLRKFSLSAIAVCLLLMSAQARAQFQAGDWTLTLSGNGTNGQDFDSAQFAVNADIGYFFTNQLELALRQSIGYTDLPDDGGNFWVGTTAVALDWHFDLGQWQPYVGANVGFAYGDFNDTGFGGPEGGVKYFVNSTTYIEASVAYSWFFDSDENLDDGQFVYGLGIGFRWR